MDTATQKTEETKPATDDGKKFGVSPETLKIWTKGEKKTKKPSAKNGRRSKAKASAKSGSFRHAKASKRSSRKAVKAKGPRGGWSYPENKKALVIWISPALKRAAEAFAKKQKQSQADLYRTAIAKACGFKGDKVGG